MTHTIGRGGDAIWTISSYSQAFLLLSVTLAAHCLFLQAKTLETVIQHMLFFAVRRGLLASYMELFFFPAHSVGLLLKLVLTSFVVLWWS